MDRNVASPPWHLSALERGLGPRLFPRPRAQAHENIPIDLAGDQAGGSVAHQEVGACRVVGTESPESLVLAVADAVHGIGGDHAGGSETPHRSAQGIIIHSFASQQSCTRPVLDIAQTNIAGAV